MKSTIYITANTSWYIKNFRKNTISALISLHYNVIVMCPDSEHKEFIESLGATFRLVRMDLYSVNPLKEMRTVIEYFKVFYGKYGCVLTFTPKSNIYACIAAKILGYPVILNISGVGQTFSNSGLSGKITRALYGLISRLSNFIFFQNEEDCNLFCEKYSIDHKKTEILPGSGVSLQEFPFFKLNTCKPVRFGLFCRLIEPKGVRIFCEAIRKIKFVDKLPIEAVVAGMPSDDPKLAVPVSDIHKWQSDGVIEFLGSLEDVREDILNCECVVLPSTYSEGTPRILLEAGALGRIIITTDHAGCRRLVNGKNGILVEPNDVESLAAAIVTILNLDEKTRLEMGCESRVLIERCFDERLVLSAYEAQIEKLL